jgi:putative solute:sodium symporter small subunit
MGVHTMPSTQPPDKPSRKDLRVNFFRPRPGFMRKEVTIIWFTLIAWALLTFGLPVHVAMKHSDPASAMQDVPSIFGLPFYFLFEGQFVIVWFIIICFIFNTLIDWLTNSYRTRR